MHPVPWTAPWRRFVTENAWHHSCEDHGLSTANRERSFTRYYIYLLIEMWKKNRARTYKLNCSMTHKSYLNCTKPRWLRKTIFPQTVWIAAHSETSVPKHSCLLLPSLALPSFANTTLLTNWRSLTTRHQESLSASFFPQRLLTSCLCATFW